MLALTLALALQGPAIELAFLADDPQAPSLVVAISNTGKQRTLLWALVPSLPALSGSSGSLTDQAGAPSDLTLPQAPRGAGLVERDGALSITVDDAGAWEQSWQSLAPSKDVAAMPVAGPRAFRVIVYGVVDGGPTKAILYGNKLRIAGTAIVASPAEAGEPRAIVTTAAPANKAPLFFAAPATAVDRVAGCGGEVPSAVSVVTTSLALKLFARGAPVCAGDLAVIPVEGIKLEAKKDVAVRGVVFRRR